MEKEQEIKFDKNDFIDRKGLFSCIEEYKNQLIDLNERTKYTLFHLLNNSSIYNSKNEKGDTNADYGLTIFIQSENNILYNNLITLIKNSDPTRIIQRIENKYVKLSYKNDLEINFYKYQKDKKDPNTLINSVLTCDLNGIEEDRLDFEVSEQMMPFFYCKQIIFIVNYKKLNKENVDNIFDVILKDTNKGIELIYSGI